MYGTIARFRPKKGQEKAVVAMFEDWRKNRKAKVQGAVATYTYRLDKDPGLLVMAVVFKDKASYMKNADDPEQDAFYRKWRSMLEADPEWEDGEIIAVD